MASLSRIAGSVVAAGMALSALSGAARAEDKFGWSAIITGTSDYMFRGISFTNEGPAFQPYVEGTYGMFYLATWASNIGEGDEGYGPWEVDVYGGIRPVTGPVNWDLGVLYYMYGSRTAGIGTSDISYAEFKIAASMSPATNWTVGLTGYYTPDQNLAVPETGTIEGAVSYTLPALGVFTPTIGGILGYTTSDTTADYPAGGFLGQESYTYWNAGLKLTVEKFFMDVRYWDTNLSENVNNGFNVDTADSRVVFSAGVTLP